MTNIIFPTFHQFPDISLTYL